MTACHDGVVHNYLSAMRLGEAARKLHHEMRLEVWEQSSVAQALSVDEIAAADLAIMAVDSDVHDSERFAALPMLRVTTREAITQPSQVITRLLALMADEEGRAFRERKLFTAGTGQAIAAYMGAAMGYTTVKDAMADPEIFTVVKGALGESGGVLVVRRRVEKEGHARYIEKALGRMANPWSATEIRVFAAEPQLKLGKNERLIGPLAGAIELELPYANLAWGVAAALCYTDPRDLQALALQDAIRSMGISAVIAQYVQSREVAKEIEKCWETIRKR